MTTPAATLLPPAISAQSSILEPVIGQPGSVPAGTSPSKETKVVTWSLGHSVPGVPECMPLEYKNTQGESISDPDLRKLVKPEHYAPGGKYRPVVKLFCQYARQDKSPNAPWAIGTGWLIRDDLIATAGHNSFDWRYSFGPVARVRAYIGYYGKQSLKDETVQFRSVTAVATTIEWMTSRDNRRNDMSIMKVSPPFTGVIPVKYASTPVSGEEMLGVVGYPGDKMNTMTGEKGDRMYEEFAQVKFNRATQQDHMLEYVISTFGGNSGSPVFRKYDPVKKQFESIGVHVYNGDLNSASCIGNLEGANYFKAFISVLSPSSSSPPATKINAPPDLDVGPDTDFYAVTHSLEESGGLEDESGEEGFLNGLTHSMEESGGLENESGKEVFLDGLTTALNVGGGIAGALGGPYGAAAGIAMQGIAGIANLFGKSESTGLEVAAVQSLGVVERGIIQESALQAIATLDPAKRKRLNIDDYMQQTTTQLMPTMKKISPALVSVIAGPALSMTIDTLEDAKTNKPQTESAFRYMPNRRKLNGIRAKPGQAKQNNDPHTTEGFLNAMLAPTIHTAGPESFFGGLGTMLETGMRVPTPILTSMKDPSVTGLFDQLQTLKSDYGQQTLEALVGATERAVMGAAALQALQKLPEKTLKEEGLLDTLKGAFQTIGPIVVKQAPSVLNGVATLVQGLNPPAK